MRRGSSPVAAQPAPGRGGAQGLDQRQPAAGERAGPGVERPAARARIAFGARLALAACAHGARHCGREVRQQARRHGRARRLLHALLDLARGIVLAGLRRRRLVRRVVLVRRLLRRRNARRARPEHERGGEIDILFFDGVRLAQRRQRPRRPQREQRRAQRGDAQRRADGDQRLDRRVADLDRRQKRARPRQIVRRK